MDTESPTVPAQDLFAAYRAASGIFDESHTAAGTLRSHYGGLRQSLDELGGAELKRRHDTCQRLVQEQGITYNIYGDPRGMERPWQLDPIPFVIAPDEWRKLEAGLIQRATLLNKNSRRLLRAAGVDSLALAVAGARLRAAGFLAFARLRP